MGEKEKGRGRGSEGSKAKRRTGALPHMTCLHNAPGRFRVSEVEDPCRGSESKAQGVWRLSPEDDAEC